MNIMNIKYWNTEQANQSRFIRNRALREILESVAKGKCSQHNANAETLPYFIEQLEARKIPYTIKAMPGLGYQITGNPS